MFIIIYGRIKHGFRKNKDSKSAGRGGSTPNVLVLNVLKVSNMQMRDQGYWVLKLLGNLTSYRGLDILNIDSISYSPPRILYVANW